MPPPNINVLLTTSRFRPVHYKHFWKIFKMTKVIIINVNVFTDPSKTFKVGWNFSTKFICSVFLKYGRGYNNCGTD